MAALGVSAGESKSINLNRRPDERYQPRCWEGADDRRQSSQENRLRLPGFPRLLTWRRNRLPPVHGCTFCDIELDVQVQRAPEALDHHPSPVAEPRSVGTV